MPIPSQNSPAAITLYDPCYGIYYLDERYDFRSPNVVNPFAAPGNILRDILERNIQKNLTLLTRLIPGPILNALPINISNKLLHALGTWHIAEEIINFGRIKIVNDADTSLSDHQLSTLTGMLYYGDGHYDTLLEEFSLAAFFQAYLELEEQPADIRQLLGSSTFFKSYQEGQELDGSFKPIQIAFINYWVFTDQNSDTLIQALENSEFPKQDIEKSVKIATWIKEIFFTNYAPLNLRHLDLLTRIYWHCYGPKSDVVFNRVIQGFLNRIRIAPRNKRDVHLLPDEMPWTQHCPYYVPAETDEPIYRYLLPFLESFRLFHQQRTSNQESTLAYSFGPTDAMGFGVGLLRLSLVDSRGMNASARVFRNYMARLNVE